MQSIIETVMGSFETLLAGFIAVFPALLAAFLVLVIGWAIAALVGGVVARLVNLLWIEKLVERLRIKDAFSHMGLKLNFAGLIGWLVKWFLIIAFLIAAADILGWDQVTSFLKDVALYIPQVFVAVVILVAGIVAADFVFKVVSKAVKSAGLVSSGFVSGVAKWAVLIFSVLVALDQLDIGRTLLNTLVQGFVATVAIGAGLAFGLGGKDHAGRFLDRIRKDISG